MRRRPKRNPLPVGLRDDVLREQPRCPCGRPSQEVHHQSNRGMAWKDHSRRNLLAVCSRCHRAIDQRGKKSWLRWLEARDVERAGIPRSF